MLMCKCLRFDRSSTCIGVFLLLCAFGAGQATDNPNSDNKNLTILWADEEIASLHNVHGVGFSLNMFSVVPSQNTDSLVRTSLPVLRRNALSALETLGVDLKANADVRYYEADNLGILFTMYEDRRGCFVLFCEAQFHKWIATTSADTMSVVTWETRRMVTTSSSNFGEDVADIVDDLTKEFALDYLFANQEGYQEKHDSLVRLEKRKWDSISALPFE